MRRSNSWLTGNRSGWTWWEKKATSQRPHDLQRTGRLVIGRVLLASGLKSESSGPHCCIDSHWVAALMGVERRI